RAGNQGKLVGAGRGDGRGLHDQRQGENRDPTHDCGVHGPSSEKVFAVPDPNWLGRLGHAQTVAKCYGFGRACLILIADRLWLVSQAFIMVSGRPAGVPMREHEPTRKLTTILCADAVEYSRMMRADEEGTYRALRDCREIFDQLTEAHK